MHTPEIKKQQMRLGYVYKKASPVIPKKKNARVHALPPRQRKMAY